MRKLHLVGYTPDLEGLIFTARRGSKSGGYVVAIEDALVDTIDEARRRRNGDAGPEELAHPAPARPGADRPNRPESTLTPREIQARLRAGRSIAQVAAEARVDPDWVERFAVPILAEQAQIVELARASTYSKPRLGPSTQPLGASVAWNLADKGVHLPGDVLASAWTAHQVHDTVWRVRLGYRSRGRAQEAVWELDVEGGQLVARNRLASELGHIERGRRRRAVSRLRAGADGEAQSEGESEAPRRRAARSRRPARKGVAKRAVPRKAVAKKAVAKKSPARKSPGRKSAAPRKPARRLAARKSPGTRSVPKTPAPKRAAVKKSAVRKSAAKSSAAKKSAQQASAARKGPRRAAKKSATAPKGARKASASALDTPRKPINRVAGTKVAASRAAANRLAGDRAVGNTLPPEPPGSMMREASWSPPRARPTTAPAAPQAQVRSTPAPRQEASRIDVTSLLDDTPPPPAPPPRPTVVINRRSARPARPPFGVRPSPAPAG